MTEQEQRAGESWRKLRFRAGGVLILLLGASAIAILSFIPSGRVSEFLIYSVLTIGGIVFWIGLFSVRDRLRLGRDRSQLEQLMAHDPAATVLSDLAAGRVIYANPAARKLFEQGKGLKIAEIFDPQGEIRPVGLSRLMQHAYGSGAGQGILHIADGYFDLSVHKTHDRYLSWRFADVSHEFGETFDTTPLPRVLIGGEDKILAMNRTARELLGDDVTQADQIFIRMPVRSGHMNDINTLEGRKGCFAIKSGKVENRQQIILIPQVLATERHPEDWSFFEELPVPLLKVKRDGEIELSNHPARHLLGVEVCQGRRLPELLEGLGRSIPDWLDDAAAGRGTVQSEFLRVRRKDKEVFVQVMLTRAMECRKTVLIAVLNDATQFKSLEAQFVQSQKMQAIGQLAGGIAHDFNNLLMAISGHCDLLLTRHDPEDCEYSDLMQIRQNTNRAAALVSQLLAFSRKQTLRPQLIDLRDILADLTHLLNRLVGEKVTLNLCHDPDLKTTRADKRQLEQVLMNLVVNARDAMPKGGEIRILTENLTLTSPFRRDRACVAPGQYVQLKVVDAGIGIPEDKLQKVFEPFFTTKGTGKGTGLGLSTAYGIIKQTGGFIFVDSKPGEGTSFSILLPAYDQVEPEEQAGKPPPARLAGQDHTVLLVEDEAPVRAFASRALQMRGFRVHEAASGEAALEMLELETVKPDVIVSDVVMPGIDGPGWVRIARDRNPDVGVVFMSGYAEGSFPEMQARISNSVFLPKPYSLEELVEAVRRQVPEPNPQPAKG